MGVNSEIQKVGLTMLSTISMHYTAGLLTAVQSAMRMVFLTALPPVVMHVPVALNEVAYGGLPPPLLLRLVLVHQKHQDPVHGLTLHVSKVHAVFFFYVMEGLIYLSYNTIGLLYHFQV